MNMRRYEYAQVIHYEYEYAQVYEYYVLSFAA